MYLNEKKRIYKVLIKINLQSTKKMILRISASFGTCKRFVHESYIGDK